MVRGHAVRRGLLMAIVLTLAMAGHPGAQAPAAPQGGRLVTTWYFYTVKWGFQNEFEELFRKNHYPVLKARQEAGAFTSIRIYTPRYHGDGRADWTFAVELTEREGAGGPSEAEIVRRLYPDQETFRREERRRFELLVAHWDVPLRPVDFEAKP